MLFREALETAYRAHQWDVNIQVSQKINAQLLTLLRTHLIT